MKDEIIRLTTYANKMKEALDSSTPEKHKNREEDYRAWLKKEFDYVKGKLESLKLGGTGK